MPDTIPVVSPARTIVAMCSNGSHQLIVAIQGGCCEAG